MDGQQIEAQALAVVALGEEHMEKIGGGTAELQLIESEDPLEAGLDILAKPPGKKPATLSLLSGGEQALTALALFSAVALLFWYILRIFMSRD